MENQIIKIKEYHSEKFFRVNRMRRYTNDTNGGRHAVIDTVKSEDFHLYFCSHGQMTITGKKETFILNAFDLLIYKPSGKQEIISPDKGSYMHCIFSGSAASEILSDLNLECGIVYHITPEYQEGKNYLFYNKQIEYVWAEYRKKKEFSELSCACMLIEFLSLYSRNKDIKEQDPALIQIKKLIEEIHRIVAEDSFKKINIDKIIADSNLSKSHFYRLFKKHTGSTPLGFITNLRLTAAADYLTLYDYKINDISNRLGFEDALYFSRSFKKAFGVSPKKYRELNKFHQTVQNENK